jgi:exonuclease-1
MLIYFGVKPYLVFDGDNLPSKAGTEQDRLRRRQESKALGLELQRKGKMPEAYQEFQKAVDVTPYMARQLIEELKQMDVQYVVAPYEADSQLVYLEQQGHIQGIISEDSDLLVFGAKRLLSKLDQHGECIEINRADFTACREVSLVGWSDADFRHMCILSGCDYLANIPKMGLKTAYRSIRKYKTVERALRMIQFDGQFKVPADYLSNFRQAELTFLYQRVFCTTAQKLVTLTVPEDGVNIDELPFIGADVEAATAAGVARGDLDPSTKEPIELKPMATGKLPLGISRRQTLGSSSELKPSKPINSFFTPKRTPLGELDPNSLTPSPSQQRLLERNTNNSWQANSAPLRSNSTRNTPLRAFSDQAGLSPMVRSVERNSFSSQPTRGSTLQRAATIQPIKRQRLCSEAEDDSLPTRPDSRSRFFGPKADQASPTGQKLSRSKKQRKSMMDVFSDEVAEDIFSSIPDLATSAEPTEPQGSTIQASAASDHDKQTVNASSASSATKLAPPPATKPAKDDDFDQALEYHVQRQNTTILSKFTFKSSPQTESVPTRSPATRLPVIQPRDRPAPLGSPRTPGGNPQNRSPQRRRLTPLQRMGHAALTRSHSINFPTKLRLADSMESQSDTSPMPAESYVTGGSSAQGSEDLIIPDSEDEEEDEEGETRMSARAKPLDLKRFSFAAH